MPRGGGGGGLERGFKEKQEGGDVALLQNREAADE